MKQDPRLYAKAFAEVAAGPLDPAREQEIIRNFSRLLAERVGRKQWPKFLAAAEKALRQKEGRRKVTFETARPIPGLKEQFRSVLRPDDVIEEKVDPQLVAGVKITLDDTRQFDGSLAKKLAALFASKGF